MTYNRFDIQIIVRLEAQTGIDSNDILRAMGVVENAIYQSDRRELTYVARRLQIPSLLTDAAKERLRDYRNERFRINSADRGSIVIEGAVVATALYVLKKTVGDAFEEGFKRTNTRARMVEFFRDQVDEKAAFIVEVLRRSANRLPMIVKVRHRRSHSERPHRIELELVQDDVADTERPPLLGEEFDPDQ